MVWPMLNETITYLDQISFSAFIDSGFVVQYPATDRLILGVNRTHIPSKVRLIKSNFFQTKFEELYFEYTLEVTRDEFVHWVSKNCTEILTLTKVKDHDHDYMDDVKTSIDWIDNESNISKLVAVTRAYLKTDNVIHPIANILKLIQLNGYLYGHWEKSKGVIGVSPEPLFYKENNTFKTMALAGTISTDIDDYEKVILSDDKELEEHNLVIEDILTKLRPIASNLNVEKTFCYNYGPFAHLKTPISFQYEGVNYKNLIYALGPTSALGGFPSKNTFQYLQKLKYYQYEQSDREFGGVIGVDGVDDPFSLVMIRNLVWDNDNYIIDSGSGIVSASSPENEVSEVQKKRNAIESIYRAH